MSSNEFSDLCVMAIDDEAFARGLIVRVLENLGVGVVSEAENGVDALAKLEAADPPVDLVISDIEMPEMNGYEFVRRLRYGTLPAYKALPVIMLTGKDTDKNVRRARIHKISGFVVKPPDMETLKDHIRRAVRGDA